MKRMILIAAFGLMLSCAAMAQLPSPFYTGITIGAKSVPNKMAITKLTGSGNKIYFYNSGTLLSIVNPDSTSAKGLFVETADSIVKYVTPSQLSTASGEEDLVEAYKLINDSIIALPLCPAIFSGGMNINNGYLYGVMVYVKKTRTCHGIKYLQHTQGALTASNFTGVGLFKKEGVNWILVAVSANVPTMWTRPSGAYFIPFTSNYVAAPGIYMLTELTNWSAMTTQPMAVIANTCISGFQDILSSPFKPACFIAGQSTMPATISAASMTKTTNFIGLILF